MKKLIILAIFSANLFGHCYEPTPPFCLQSYGNFNYNSCKLETEHYLDELDEYYECTARELAEQINEAKQNAIDVFNCKASGDCQ